MAVGSEFAFQGRGQLPASRCPRPRRRSDRRIAGFAVTQPQDLDEWSLAGLTREQGLARWSGVFAGRPPASRMSMSTGWGWVTWEPTDPDAAQLARLAGRTPKPVLTEIAVRDPDSRTRKLSPPPASDPVTTSAWSALSGLIGGGVAGMWWWGLQLPTLVLAVAGAGGTLGTSILWRRWSASRRPPVKVLTERDSAAPNVLAGAKIADLGDRPDANPRVRERGGPAAHSRCSRPATAGIRRGRLPTPSGVVGAGHRRG